MSLDERILEILYTYYLAHPGNAAFAVATLYLRLAQEGHPQENVLLALLSLKENGMIAESLTDHAQAGTVSITTQGITAIATTLRITSQETAGVSPRDTDADDNPEPTPNPSAGARRYVPQWVVALLIGWLVVDLILIFYIGWRLLKGHSELVDYIGMVAGVLSMGTDVVSMAVTFAAISTSPVETNDHREPSGRYGEHRKVVLIIGILLTLLTIVLLFSRCTYWPPLPIPTPTPTSMLTPTSMSSPTMPVGKPGKQISTDTPVPTPTMFATKSGQEPTRTPKTATPQMTRLPTSTATPQIKPTATLANPPTPTSSSTPTHTTVPTATRADPPTSSNSSGQSNPESKVILANPTATCADSTLTAKRSSRLPKRVPTARMGNLLMPTKAYHSSCKFIDLRI